MRDQGFVTSLLLFLLWPGVAAAELESTGAEAGATSAGVTVVAGEEATLEHMLRFSRELHRVAAGLDLPNQERASGERLTRLLESLRAFDKLTCPAGQCSQALERKRQRLLALAEAVARGARLPAPIAEKRAAGSCAQAATVPLGERIKGAEGASSFFRFQAPADGRYLVDSFGSRGDSQLAVYGGCGGELIAANDDSLGLSAAVTLELQRQDVVWIELSGVGGEPVAAVLGGGTVSGTVRDSAGAPLQGIGLALVSLSNSFSRYATTAADGSYSFAAVGAGNWVVRTDHYDSIYVHGAWEDVLCELRCTPEEATPIPVAEGEQVTGIDLTLPRGGEITGRVRLRGTIDPVAGATVTAYSPNGTWVDSATTDSAGRYRLEGLAPGDYRVRGYDDELGGEMWQDRPCDGLCDVLDGDLVSVDYDGQETGIDFQLDARGAIEVRLTHPDTGHPLFADSLWVYDSDGELVASSSFSQRIGGLETGTYYLLLRDYGFLDFVWLGLACEWTACDPTAGTPLAVVEGETLLLETDVVLNGEVSGRIIAEADGEPLDATATLYTPDGVYVDSWSTFSDGLYSIRDVAPGTFRIAATGAGVVSEAWDDIPCTTDCATAGDVIVVEAATETRDIDFSLVRLGSISGRITDHATGLGIVNARARLYDKDGIFVSSRGVGLDGEFRFLSLAASDYFVTAEHSAYEDELWNDLPCEGGCDVTQGAPINVVLETETPGIDLALVRKPWLEGTVLEQGSGEPISFGGVTLYDTAGGWADSASVNGGSYVFNALQEGTYYAVARGRDQHVDVLWGYGPCYRGVSAGGCDPLDGTAIVVDADGTTVDFELPLGGVISGTVSHAADGGELTSGSVYIFDQHGQSVGLASFDGQGGWSERGFGTGTYFAATSFTQFVDQLWSGQVCESPSGAFPQCDVTAGTPIAVTIGAEVTGIDFMLDELGQVRGTLRSEDGGDLDYGFLHLYDSTGTRVGSAFVGSAAISSFHFDRLQPGHYFLGTEEFDGNHDRIFGGDSCEPGPCDPSSGTPVTVALNGTTGPIDIVLDIGPGFDVAVRSITGTPVAGASIDVWDGNGQWLQTVLTGADGTARAGMPAGTYRLSTDNGQGLVDELWQDVPCPDGPAYLGLCDLAAATPVVLTTPVVEPVHFELEDPAALFYDGFESGSTSAWSSSQP